MGAAAAAAAATEAAAGASCRRLDSTKYDPTAREKRVNTAKVLSQPRPAPKQRYTICGAAKAPAA